MGNQNVNLSVNIRRLQPQDAAAITDCFRRVYGDSYANELFYQPERLAVRMQGQRIGCVGAVDADGRVIGHMAMTIHPDARVVELGNTVVDPAARGGGLAWQIGAALTDWCLELGYRGYLHYPTTDHHIMQRQSVRKGFEIGLMLGYIPAETHGQVSTPPGRGRQAATIVYQPLIGTPEEDPAGAPDTQCAADVFLPPYPADLVRAFSEATGLQRHWHPVDEPTTARSETRAVRFDKRALARLTVTRVGTDFSDQLAAFDGTAFPCRQLDFSMDDPGIGAGVEAARELGYWFCGWLPGFTRTDMLRLQQVDRARTDMSPALVNPVAKSLLDLVPAAS